MFTPAIYIYIYIYNNIVKVRRYQKHKVYKDTGYLFASDIKIYTGIYFGGVLFILYINKITPRTLQLAMNKRK